MESAELRAAAAVVWPQKDQRSYDTVYLAVFELLVCRKGRHPPFINEIGHQLSIQLGRTWRHELRVKEQLASFLEKCPCFTIQATDGNKDVHTIALNEGALLAAAAATKGGASSTAGNEKVKVVPRPKAAASPSAAAKQQQQQQQQPQQQQQQLIGSFSPAPAAPQPASKPGEAALIAIINTVRWCKDAGRPGLNMLRQSLAATIVRRATAAAGGTAPGPDSSSWCIDAAEAADVLEKAWRARHGAEPLPFRGLPELLAGDRYLQLRPAAGSGNPNTSTANGSAQQLVQLNVQRLLQHPAAAGSPMAASPAATGTLPAAGKLQTPKQMPKAAAGAGGSKGASPAALKAGAAERQAPRVPKQLLLDFVEQHEWSSNEEFNLMKRALATVMVQEACGSSQDCPVPCAAVTQHIAQAGEVLHKLWVTRHGTNAKPYKRVADVLGNDELLSVADGERHKNELVRFDLAMAAAMAEKLQQEGRLRPCKAYAAPAAAAASAGAARAASAGAAARTAAGATSQGPTNSEGSKAAADAAADQAAVKASAGIGGRTFAAGASNSGDWAAAAAAAAGPPAALLPGGGSSVSAIMAAAGASPQAVAARAASGELLAIDLLGFAGLFKWHESNPGLALLRQQLACQLIEAAHPDLADAVAAGRRVPAVRDAASYCMSPYAAGSALVATWQQHSLPGQPRPYTTLPSALEGDRYLRLQLQGQGGYSVQLDVVQMFSDAVKTMQDLQDDWDTVAVAGARAVAARARSAVAAAGADAAAGTAALRQLSLGSLGGSSPDGSAVGGVHASPLARLLQQQQQQAMRPLAAPQQQGSLASGLPVVSTVPAVPGRSAAVQGNDSRVLPAGGMGASPACGDAGQLQQVMQPCVPDMSQLLQLLSCCSWDVCSAAQVFFVPQEAQQAMFCEPDALTPELRQLLQGVPASADDAMHGVQRINDEQGVSRMVDHLLVCPCIALDCTTGGTGGSGELLLLQVLAPAAAGGEAAAVYVFEVATELLGAGRQTNVLLSILLEDARVVKLVKGGQQVVSWLHTFGIGAVGLIDVTILEAMLRPAGLLQLDSLASAGVDAGPEMEGLLAGHKSAVARLEGSTHWLQSCQGLLASKPVPGGVVSAASATVKPLMPLASALLQLLPLAIMRIGDAAAAAARPGDAAHGG